jgi:hypothetical protein
MRNDTQYEYLATNLWIYIETHLEHESVDQMDFLDEKTAGQKSQASVPVRPGGLTNSPL